MLETDPVFSALCEAYAAGNLIVFAGAGISAAAGLPNWHQLTRQLITRINAVASNSAIEEANEYLSKGNLIDALSAVKLALGPQEFGLAIENALSDRERDVPEAARAIAALAPKLRAILTTNLDYFLERALNGTWPSIARVTADLASRRGYILKLHGSLLERDTWIFSREQYDRRMFGSPECLGMFRALFATCPMVFVGCGLSDADLDQVFAEIRAIANEKPPQHFALVPYPVPPLRRRQLESAGLRIIDYPNADGTHRELALALRSLGTLAIVNPGGRAPVAFTTARPVSASSIETPPGDRETTAASVAISAVPETIKLLAALPEHDAQQFQGEYEALIRSRRLEGAMVCQHAWRCAEILARHVYLSNSRCASSHPSGSVPFEQVVDGLLAAHQISDAVAKHLLALCNLGQAKWEPSSEQSTRRAALKCRKAIQRVLDWFVSIEPVVAAHDYLLSDTYVQSEEHVTEGDIRQTVDIDNRVFAHAPGTPLPSYDCVTRWYRRNPLIYILLKDRKSTEVVGYINAMPLFDQTFQEICNGSVDIAELEHKIRRYDIPDFYRIYICSIGVLEEYRTPGNLCRLLDAFFLRVYRLAQKNIYVLDVVTDAATGEGEQMCISFGMHTTNRTSHDFPIYRTRMLPPQFTVFTDHALSVRKHYEDVYTRFRDLVDHRYSAAAADITVSRR